MTEFGLVYGNDWFLLPLELPVGALYDLSGFEVRDSFGRGGADPCVRPPAAAAAGVTLAHV